MYPTLAQKYEAKYLKFQTSNQEMGTANMSGFVELSEMVLDSYLNSSDFEYYKFLRIMFLSSTICLIYISLRLTLLSILLNKRLFLYVLLLYTYLNNKE